MALLSLVYGSLASVVALSCAGIYFVLPYFGSVSIWQVLSYIDAPISLLQVEQQRTIWMCYGIGFAVFAFVALAFVLLSRLFSRRFGWRGILVLNLCFAIFLAEGLYFTFEYADSYFGLRYEIRCRLNPSTLFADEFKKVEPESVSFPLPKRNLVVLVGESIERSFIDGAAFGSNLMPRLEDWERNHLTWGTMWPVHGVDHTICALFGMIYGVPRLQIDGIPRLVSFSDYPELVIPNAWDVWLRNGFSCRFVKGGEIEFACTDKVFRSVPGVEVHDKAFYETDPDYLKEPKKHPYGVHDEVVIAKRLRQETLELAAREKPFVLMVWTLNTHCSFGWVSSFKTRRQPTILADAVMQADDMIVDYLEWLEKQSFASDTAIVFLGDHIFHGDFKTVRKDQRYPIHAYSADWCQCRTSKRIFAAFDLAPTFLELTGAKLPDGRFGLGSSLLREQPTLLERIGRKRYEDEIRSCGADYRRIAFGW